MKAGNRLRLLAMDVKNRVQPGDLQKIAYLLIQIQ